MTDCSHWQWQNGKQPGPQSATPGSCWRMVLPLTGDGNPPACHFDSDLFQICPPDPRAAPLELVLNLPANIDPGIHFIQFSFHTEPPITGRFPLKILASQAAGSSPKASAPNPEPVSVDQPGTPVFSPANALQVTATRDGKPIPALTRRLKKHKSLLIGKTSVSRGILPDIDLKPHFASRGDAKQCSRSQARIYRTGARVVLENLGKGSITGPDGRIIRSGESLDDWLPGQTAGLPGGITIKLEKII